ncbi:MAG TPA: AAA family ATPase [Stellaceae bacterium]|nr:AAA family ATPase [Stellaceae bacterium]
MECPSCHSDTPDTSKFCISCGAALPARCPSCGSANPAGANFCFECGQKLAETPSKAATTSTPAPPARTEGTAERRQLTVMFCDLVGSTALSARLDPEDMREIIGAYHRCCAEQITKAGGFVAKYMGDGVLAYFGYPQAHEDDAERAVRAGLALVDAVGQLQASERLRVRVGIATGLVVVGDLVGSGEAQERGVVGETPNLAARLQALAEPDVVVIAASTRRLTRGLFEYADLGAVAAKGFAEPVRAWRVLGESAAESRFEALHPAPLTPLVGREEEIDLLRRHWQRAKSGAGQVVLLSGEPGIGKSRLTWVLRERLSDEPHTLLNYFCSPYHQTSALHPFIAQLERAAGFTPKDAPKQKLDKLEALLRQATPDVSEAAPLIAALLSIPLSDRYAEPELGPQKRKERTFAALIRQLEGLAQRRPVLAVFEDAHWIDPTSRELLDLTIKRIRNLPVLLVVTFRPEFAPPWVGEPHATSLALDRLSRELGAALVERVADGKPLPSQVTDQIITRTDCVPLFVEELTKAVLESGLLKDKGDCYVLTGPLRPLAIPTRLHDALMARLDRLEPVAFASVKEVAQIGAAIGRAFSSRLLAAVAPLSETNRQNALNQLCASELVFCRSAPPNDIYVFKHALVQDAAYATLLRGKRRELHTRIAEALEERFPETVASEPELLAHHCTEAGLYAKAVHYWHRAGQRATERSANVEAIAHLTQGLIAVKALPDTPERDRQELMLQIALGSPLQATKGYAAPERKAAYARAWELCQRIEETPQNFPVLFGLWQVSALGGQVQEARELAEQLLGLARSQQDSGLLLEAHRALSLTDFLRGEFVPARAHAEQGLSIYDPEKHRAHGAVYGQDPGMSCHVYLAQALWTLGYPDQALTTVNKTVTLCRAFPNPYSLAMALGYVAMIRQYRREVEELQKPVDELTALCAEQGYAWWMAWITVFKGWKFAQQGLPEEGVSQMRQGLEGWRSTGAKAFQPHLLAMLAEGYAETGQIREGLAALVKALDIAGTRQQRFWEAELHRLRGEFLRSCSSTNLAECDACLHQALATAREQSARSLELRASTSLARLWRDQGKRTEARDLLAPIYGWFTEGFDTPDLKEAKALLEELV